MRSRALYDDGQVALDDVGVTIRRYYLPFAGSKRIPYGRIKHVEERQMGLLSGKGRIWGSGDFRHWAAFDLSRGSKNTALIFDLGGWVRPVITPDDPERVLAILRDHVMGR